MLKLLAGHAFRWGRFIIALAPPEETEQEALRRPVLSHEILPQLVRQAGRRPAVVQHRFQPHARTDSGDEVLLEIVE